MFAHHFHTIDEESGRLLGALSDLQARHVREDLQARHVRELITGAGQRFDCKLFPEAGHTMHMTSPQLYVTTLRDWASTLDD